MFETKEFIEKLIEATSNNRLEWANISGAQKFKSFKQFIESSYEQDSFAGLMSKARLDEENSFFTKFQKGYIYFLTEVHDPTIKLSGKKLIHAIGVQTTRAAPIQLQNSQSEFQVELKRLLALINRQVYDTNQFIKNFLDKG